jgi:hypothetical protein
LNFIEIIVLEYSKLIYEDIILICDDCYNEIYEKYLTIGLFHQLCLKINQTFNFLSIKCSKFFKIINKRVEKYPIIKFYDIIIKLIIKYCSGYEKIIDEICKNDMTLRYLFLDLL